MGPQRKVEERARDEWDEWDEWDRGEGAVKG